MVGKAWSWWSSDMQRYEILNASGDVVNVIVADEQFVEANYPGQYRLAGDTDPTPAARPAIVVTNIEADAEHAATTHVSSFGEVTCIAGATITVTAELRGAGGAVLPLSDSFRMPIRASDGREKVLLASMANGIITIAAPLRDSGIWVITEELINQRLPDEAQMSFAGMTIYVVELA
jgi:hypothetical protein